MTTKKNRNLIYISLITILFLACNNQSKKTESPAVQKLVAVDNTMRIDSLPDDCLDIGTIVIKQTTAEDLMKHFDTLFRGFGTTNIKRSLVDSFWIDSAVIVSVADFLTTHTDYDGIRVHFGAQSDQFNTSNIMLAVTQKRVSSPANMGHSSDWGAKIVIPPGISPQFVDFVHDDPNPGQTVDFKKLGPMMASFISDYREIATGSGVKINDSLSKAVWISKCAIFFLSEFLKNPQNNLNGVSVYSAAYRDSSFNTNHTQIHLNQSTVIIVPTARLDKGHVDNWDIIPNTLKKRYPKFNGNGFNHGELCPNSCF